MYYEINVAKAGVHFFATAERSCRSMHAAQMVFNDIKTKFPSSEGYSVTVSHKTVEGRDETLDFELGQFAALAKD